MLVGEKTIVSPVFSRPINFLINRSILENIKHSFVEIGLFPVIAGLVRQIVFLKVENEILMQKHKLFNFQLFWLYILLYFV